TEADGELRAASFPASWQEGLAATIASLWAALPGLKSWNAAQGWKVGDGPGNPYPSAHLLAMLLLANLPADAFASPRAIEQWVVQRHPFWTDADLEEDSEQQAPKKRPEKKAAPESGIANFLLGVAFPLRLLVAAKDV